MKFETIQLTSILYAIPYNADEPIIYSLPINEISHKLYLGNNVYTIEVTFHNGTNKYLVLHDRYVNNLKGDDISKPFINQFSTFKEWNINSNDIEEDKTQYLIFDDHDKLIDEYINQFENKIEYDQKIIDRLNEEININKTKVEYIKKQKYDK